MDYCKMMKELKEKYNLQLAKVTTYTELQELIKAMDLEGFTFRMITKCGGDENGIFYVDDFTVEYITTATSRVYRSKIKNLYKVMKVV